MVSMSIMSGGARRIAYFGSRVAESHTSGDVATNEDDERHGERARCG